MGIQRATTPLRAAVRFAALVGCLMVSARAADVPSKQIASRIELYSINTLTITDQQFLKGDANGKPVTITGQLRIAQGTGRLPVVVLQHGSGGVVSNVDAWSRELNELGVSTFVLDGFTGRGLTNVNPEQASLGRLNFILDIYRALEILARHPRVDTSRIALMGFSRGGQATLYASMKRFHRLWNKSGVEFAAYLPFYPDCMTTYVSDEDLVNRPIHVFAGTPDDYNPISVCNVYFERLRKAGHDVQVTEYPNAAHAFDSPLAPNPATVFPTYQTVRRCRIREEADGLLVNAETRQPFTYHDACVELGPHIGYDPVAAQAAQQDVAHFLKSVFKLN
jgi:dienelactone hydrolase